MAGAFWCIVEDDRKGMPKKVMAEVLGEAARLGGPAEAVWLVDKAADEGLEQLGEWGAAKVWLVENPALAAYQGEVWVPMLAELASRETPKAILAPVTSRQRELMARLAARLGAGLAADSVALAMEGDRLVAVWTFEFSGDAVRAIRGVTNPDKLAHISSTILPSLPPALKRS